MDQPPDTRTRLLEAASVVFAEHGFARATVREICDRAGTNVAAVNYHFGDKRRLYNEAIKRAHQLKWDEQGAPEWPEGLSPEAKLRFFVEQLLACMLSDASMPHHRQLILQEMARPSEATSELVDEFIGHEFARLVGVISELAPTLAPERARMTAFSVVGQCLYYKLARPVVERLVGEEALGSYSREALAAHIADVVLAALGRAPSLVERATEEV